MLRCHVYCFRNYSTHHKSVKRQLKHFDIDIEMKYLPFSSEKDINSAVPIQKDYNQLKGKIMAFILKS